MNKRRRRCLYVADTQKLSANMQRITFAGDDLADFPPVKPGAYIKILLNPDGSGVTDLDLASDEITIRTYTVRMFDRDQGTLTVDFALHSGDLESGPASRWAESAKVGDKICIGGPGSIKEFPTEYDWVLFAGDITAIPAIESQLALLPEDTQGFAVISVNDAADIRDLVKPQGVKAIWLTSPTQRLANELSRLEMPTGKPAIWAASEFSQMREMRSLFNNQWNIARNSYYISSYWKIGRSEEQHKIDKRKDAAKDSLNPANLYNKAKQLLVPS